MRDKAGEEWQRMMSWLEEQEGFASKLEMRNVPGQTLRD